MASRILAIDDDPYNLDLFRMLLQLDGYEVILPDTAYEKMAEVEAIHPHLIILDIRLPREQEGFTLLQKLKLYRSTKDIPVIIRTAAVQSMKDQEETLREMGIPIIYKPYDIDELLRVVKQCLPLQN